MARHKMTKLYTFRVELRVKSRFGSFPIDMLRYDRCVPDSQEDASKIAMHLSNYDDAMTEQERTITVRMYDGSGRGPTVGRWESFGVEVLKVEKL